MDSSSRFSPATERLWSDEVRYLHSLWRIGPPRSPRSAARPPPASSKPLKKEQASSKPLNEEQIDRKKRKNNRNNKRNKMKRQKLQGQSQTGGQPNAAPTTEEVPLPRQSSPDSAPDEDNLRNDDTLNNKEELHKESPDQVPEESSEPPATDDGI